MTDRPSSTAAGALVIAPVLLLISTTLYATGGAGFNNSAAGGAVQFWAMVAFIVALLGLVRRIEDLRGTAVGWLSLLVVIGGAGGVGFGVDSQHAAISGAVNLLDSGSIAPQLSLALAGALFPISVIAVAVVAGRAGVISTAVMAIAIAGAVMFPVSRFPSIPTLGLVADVLLLAAFAPLGLAALRQRTAAPATA